jgi:hypothetical protein
VDEAKLKLARERGADEVFNSLNLPDGLQKSKAVIVVSGAAAAYDLGQKLVDLIEK